MKSELEPYQRSQKFTIETVIAVACKRVLPDDLQHTIPADMGDRRANSGLIQKGMKAIYCKHPKTGAMEWFLAIANRHRGLNKFDETKWQRGVYTQQFEQVPAPSPRAALRRGKRGPVTMVPIDAVLGEHKSPLEEEIAAAKDVMGT